MLGDFELCTETQTHFFREYSRKSSLPLAGLRFLAGFLSHKLGPVRIAGSMECSTGKDTRGTPAERGALEKTTLGEIP